MKRKRIDYYEDDDVDELYQDGQFRVPLFGRVIGFLFFLFDRIRDSIGRVIWKCTSVIRLDLIHKRIEWFFQIILFGIRWLIDWLLVHTIFSQRSEKISEARSGLIMRIGSFWALILSKIAFWSEGSSIIRWLLMPLHLFLIATGALFDFLMHWLSTRSYRQLLFGIPAILLTIPLVVCSVMIPLKSDESKARHYLAAAQEAAISEDYDAAKLYHRKVKQLRKSNDNAVWQLAMLAEKEGDLNEAYRQIKTLAPDDQLGMPLAHLWIAHAISSKRVDPQVEEPQKLLESHLRKVLVVDPKNELALRLMAEHYLITGDSSKSIQTLERVATEDRMSRLRKQFDLALIHYQVGNREEANRLLTNLSAEYETMLSENATLDVETFLRWASTAEVLGQQHEAVAVLECGLKEYPTEPKLLSANRVLNLEILKTLPVKSPDADQKRIAIATKLLKLEPDHEDVHQSIAMMYGNESLKDESLRLLQPKIDDGSLSVDTLDHLAISALMREQSDKAREFYRAVVAKDPNRPVALNNLAWILSHNEPLELDEALKMINKAISLQPNNSSMHATRGHIFVKQERWADGIRDLEHGLNGMPENKLAHQALALAYSKVGNGELAREHQRMLNRLNN